MIQNSRIGDPYAYAFLKVIYKDLNFASFSCLISDMLDFCTIFNTYPNIEQFLSNPTYDNKKKKQFLNDFFGQSLNSLLLNFLNLCDTKRIIYISSILKLFLEFLLKSTNSYVVEIEVPMTNSSKININKLNIILSNWFLKNKKETQFKNINFAYFKEPLLIYTVKQKSELLGGFKLNFLTESKIIDFSISTKISKISKILD
jgi:F0F1-type ATP synthase delta subunit